MCPVDLAAALAVVVVLERQHPLLLLALAAQILSALKLQQALLRYSQAGLHAPLYQSVAVGAAAVVVVLVAGSLVRLVVVVVQAHPLLHRGQAASLLAAAVQRQI